MKNKISKLAQLKQRILSIVINSAVEIRNKYVEDLEFRCKKANFSPFDLRVPKNNNEEFVWDKHTINNAENWLKKHH